MEKILERKMIKKKFEKMQYDTNRGDTQQLNKKIQKSYGPQKSKSITSTFLNRDGTTESAAESLDRHQQYYSELLNCQPFIELSKIVTVSQNLVSTFISTNESTNMSILSSSAPSKNDIQIIGSGLDYFGQVVLQLQTNPEIRFCIKV